MRIHSNAGKLYERQGLAWCRAPRVSRKSLVGVHSALIGIGVVLAKLLQRVHHRLGLLRVATNCVKAGATVSLAQAT